MEKVLTLLGFCKKAGKLVTGSNAVLRSILYGNAFLVIASQDAGGSIKEKFSRLCSENEIPFFVVGEAEIMEKATGEKNKVIYSVADEGFARKINQLLAELQEK